MPLIVDGEILIESISDYDSDSSSGTITLFSCDAGTDLLGSKIRQCLPNGVWSGYKSTCRRKSLIIKNLLNKHAIFLYLTHYN